MPRLRILTLTGEDFSVDLPNAKVSGARIKEAVVRSYSGTIAGRSIVLYKDGRKLHDRFEYDPENIGGGGTKFLSLAFCKPKKKKRVDDGAAGAPPKRPEPTKRSADPVVVVEAGPPKPKEGGEAYNRLLEDILGDYARGTATATTTTTTANDEAGQSTSGRPPIAAAGTSPSTHATREVEGRSLCAPKAKKGRQRKLALHQSLPLPPCLERLYETFQELAVVAGLIVQQGLQPTLSSLQRSIRGIDEATLKHMAAFAPGILAMHAVSARARFSDASPGKISARHGALAEVGLSLAEQGEAGQSSAREEGGGGRELVIDFHTPIEGRSPRLRKAPSGGGRGFRTVTGGFIHGTAFSQVTEVEGEGAPDAAAQASDEALPALIQGARSSNVHIGPMGMMSSKAYQRGHMASAMKSSILKWQRLFRQALVEVVSFRHDAFVAGLGSGGVVHNVAEQHCWHPSFSMDGLSLKDMLATAEANARNPFNIAGGRGKGAKKLAGSFKPCRKSTTLAMQTFVPHLIAQATAPNGDSRVAYVKNLERRAARFGKAPAHETLSVHVASALAGIGITQLYSHQEAAIDLVKAGANVVITTSTASGKSVCYNAPVLDTLLGDPAATALYMFPTKALAQDQLRALHLLCESIPGIDVSRDIGIYDGDTPHAARGFIMQHARILICNPDILHVNFLPNHAQFSRIFRHCRHVVLDEAHAYRGVFGSHVSLVLRRFRRILEVVYGATPQFFLSSATIANSVAHAQNLTGLGEWRYVKDDGSPCGFKSFLLWNPPHKVGYQKALEARALSGRQGGAGGAGGAGGGGRGTAAAAAAFPEAERRARLDVRGMSLNAIEEEGRRHSERTARDAIAGGGQASAGVAHPPRERLPPGTPGIGEREGEGAGEGEGEGEAAGAMRYNRSSVEAWQARMLQRRHKRKAKERVDDDKPDRVSAIMETGMLLAECVQHDLKCIAFCKTRKLSELVLGYARDFLDGIGSDRGNAIAAYRAGYSASHRREIESSLFSGSLKGVAATNALELGIDVGALDVTLHLGFPGTISSLWQQSGRAGRREQRALSIYVAFNGALDQFFMRSPERLFSSSIEHAAIDSQNPMLMEQHLACASHEYPLMVDGEESDVTYFGSRVFQCVEDLRKRRLVGRNPESAADPRWFYAGPAKRPAGQFSLRAIDETVWSVVNELSGEVVEEIEESKAFFQIYEGAVFMQQGRKYLCTKMHLKERKASVREADLQYYTSIIHMDDIQVTGGRGTSAYPDRPIVSAESAQIAYGSSALLDPCKHCCTFTGFTKIKQSTGESFDYVDIKGLPAIEYETVCTWLRVPDKARALLERLGMEFKAGVHAAAHALLNVLPLYLMCNTADAGVECPSPEETRWRPERLLIYDTQPGGTGIAAQAQPLFGNLLRAALELMEQCGCESRGGCPDCIHSGQCSQYNAMLDKEAGMIILKVVLESEDAYLEGLRSQEERAKDMHGGVSRG